MSLRIHTILLIGACLFAWSVSFSADDALRTWTDIDGRSIRATGVSKSDEEIQIRRSDGLVFTIPLSRLSDEDRAWIDQWEPHEEPAASLEDGLVLIETPLSRGSGFLANFGDGVFLVTNQHVIEGVPQREVKITNLNGEHLTPRRLEVSPTQDLARIALSAPTGLRLRYETSYETEITAYGNSRGGGVATNSRGKVVGISRDVVEVTAEIVQGNSGGPVIDDDGYVIGVAAYVTIEHPNPEDWVSQGTRYESPRRFAIRLRDDLEWRRMDWDAYGRETGYLRQAEEVLEQATQLAGAIIANPTTRVSSHDSYAEPIQEIIRTHNQHVRRFESNLGRTVRNQTDLRRANQSQNANFRTRMRRITEALNEEVNSLSTGRPAPSTPYLSERLKNLEEAVAQANDALEKAMQVERSFYR